MDSLKVLLVGDRVGREAPAHALASECGWRIAATATLGAWSAGEAHATDCDLTLVDLSVGTESRAWEPAAKRVGPGVPPALVLLPELPAAEAVALADRWPRQGVRLLAPPWQPAHALLAASSLLAGTADSHELPGLPALFESNPEPMWIYDAETLRFLEVNSAATGEYGWSRKEFLAMSLRDIRPAEDLAKFALAASSQMPQRSYSGLWRHLRRDGSIRHVEIHSHAIEFQRRPARLVMALDRTAQVEAEARLRESEEKYRRLFESSHLGIAVLAAGGVVDSANEALDLLFDASPGSLAGRRLLELAPAVQPDGTPSPVRAAKLLSEALGGRRGSFKWRHLTLGGREFDALYSVAPVAGSNDHHLIAILRDVTEHEAQRSAAKALADRLELAVTGAVLILWDWEPGQGRLTVGGQLQQVLGYPAAEQPRDTRGWRDLVHWEDIDPLEQAFSSHLSGSTAHCDSLFRARHRDGGWRWLLGRGRVVERDAAGRPVRLAGTMIDVTTEQETRLKLEEYTQLVSAVLESSQTMIWVREEDGRLVLANPAARMFFGDTLEAGGSRAEDESVDGSSPPQSLAALTRAALASRGTVRAEIPVVRADGAPSWLEVTKAPLVQPDGSTRLLAIATDSTQRHWANERLRTLSRAVEQSPVSTVITDLHGNITFVNPRFSEVTGYSQEEALGQNPRILKSGLVQPETYRELWDTITSGRVWKGDLPNRRKSGELYWERATIGPVIDGEGRTTHYLAVKEDITEAKRAAEELRQSNELLERYFSTSLDLLAILGCDGTLRRLNPQWEETLGFSMHHLRGQSLVDFIHPGDRGEADRMIAALARGESVTGLVVRCRHRDGSYRFVEWRCRPVEDAVYAAARDVTAHKEAEAALAALSAQRELLLDSLNVQVWFLDTGYRYGLVNEAHCQFLGLPKHEVEGRPLRDVVGAAFGGVLGRLAQRAFESGKSITRDEWLPDAHGEQRLVRLQVFPSALEGGGGYAVCVASDMTERHRAEEGLRHSALHDALTGLPNRALLTDRLQLAIARHRRLQAAGFAVAYFDLDRFKIINDSLGHLVGDQLLIQFSRRLERLVRPMDTLSRIGGDEFVLLLTELPSPELPMLIAERIMSALSAPFTVEGNVLHVTSSMGLCYGHQEYRSEIEVLRDADVALYEAKKCGRNRIVVFDDTMKSRALEALSLETELRAALDRDELCVQYQPILRLTTRETVALEALVRWSHPERGLLQPGIFLPLAQEAGLLPVIERFVLKEVLGVARRLRVSRPDGTIPEMHLNISPDSLNRTSLPAEFERELASAGVPGSCLVVEIVEGALLSNPESIGERLKRLTRLGVRFAIDDFGTGYSSLQRLVAFPISQLKIDREFIAMMSPGSRGESVVRVVLSLATLIGVTASAEGIENAEQEAALVGMGCDIGQGYHLCRPLPGDKLEAWLKDHPPATFATGRADEDPEPGGAR